jgi:hypothetical protein
VGAYIGTHTIPFAKKIFILDRFQVDSKVTPDLLKIIMEQITGGISWV